MKKLLFNIILYALTCFLGCMILAAVSESFRTIEVGLLCSTCGGLGMWFGNNLKF